MDADTLSRRTPVPTELGIHVSRSSIPWELLQKEVNDDGSRLPVKLKGDIEVGAASYPGYTVERGSSYNGISSSSSLIPKLLFEYHNLAVAGQMDTMEILEHTSKLLQSGTGWECGTSGAVRKGMWNLPTEKGSHQLPGGLMQFLPILSQVWDDISMDFMEGLPKSGGSILF